MKGIGQLLSGGGFGGLKKAFGGIGDDIVSLGASAAKGIASLLGLGSAAAGTAAALGTAGAASTGALTLGAGGAGAGLFSGLTLSATGATTAVAGTGGAAAAAAGGFSILGMGLTTAIPVFGAVAAGALVLYSILHKTTQEKLVAEFTRDFGGVKIAQQTVEEFGKALGLTMKQIDGIRKDLSSSPVFLQMAFQAAWEVCQIIHRPEEK